ncbi:TonB-dependent siderophore receptor [Algoriphagus sp. H41]|uniref:TonB-dependent siderophore receptor n=1 Tax=Algoriphagus oliviformis TaxID=2811231 RepID=A0ABS3C4F5_9BACT|nr:TonB-dependent siderophore receptor [Algoriphagus oliviformis]MBN7811832.1 TonB-dependent siderophore receptor [Algoriphagus oliviformis]
MLFAALLFAGQATMGQSRLLGQLQDEKGAPVINMNVRLVSDAENKIALSDIDGNFEFQGLQGSQYRILISSMSYSSYEREIDLAQLRQPLVIVLSPSGLNLQEVEVIGRVRQDYTSEYSFSATKIAIANRDLPQAVGSVTKELIRDRQAFRLADAVKNVSGVTPSSFYNQYAIRGISQNEEGQIINGLRTRQFYFLQPLTSHIERVEVIKGPASVTFASTDPGGSINMVTKKPLAEDRKEVSLSAGSFNTIRGTLDFTGPLNSSKTLLYRLNAAYQQAGSFRDYVNNNSVLITPSITYLPSDKTSINTELIFNSMHGNLDRGQPIFGAVAGETDLNSTPISLNLGASTDYFISDELIWTANLSHKLARGLNFNAVYMKQTWKEDLQEHRTTNAFAKNMEGEQVSSLVLMQFVERKQNWDIDNLNAYLNYDFELGKTKNKLLLGYDLHSWQKLKGGGQNAARGFLLKDGSVAGSFNPANADSYQTITVDGEVLPKPNVSYFNLENPNSALPVITDYVFNSRVAIPAALTTSSAIYIQEHFQLGKLSALVSLRNEWFEDITNYGSEKELTFTNTVLLPRVGLTYSVSPAVNVYATYLEGMQPQSNTVTLMPSTGAFFWTSESASRFKPLESDLKELGVKAELFKGLIQVNSAVYEINQENILMNASLPAFPDSLVQRGADRSRGFEVDMTGFALPNWQVSMSYSYIDAVIVSDANPELEGTRKENSPKHSGNFWTRYNFEEKTKLSGLGFGLGLQAQSSRIPWFTRDFEVPAFAILDAAVYYAPIGSSVQLALNVNNVTDKTYWLGAQNYTRLFPGAPRNFILTATYKF